MKSRNEDNGIIRKWVRPIGLGSVAGAIGCLLMLLLLAAILTTQDVPQTTVSPLALIAAAVSSFIGGFFAARISGENGWLIGSLTGLVLFVLLLIAGGFTMFTDMNSAKLVLKLVSMLIAAAVGGMAGVNLRRHR